VSPGPLRRRALLAAPFALTLGGCVPQFVPGYQQVYQRYEVPDSLIAVVRARLHAEGLPGADVTRDDVGRVRVVGRFRDEDEADRALLICSAIVGLRASSPFYPEQIERRRWELAAQAALAAHAKAAAAQAPPSRKRALVVGINRFLDDAHLRPLQGEDDARLVAARLAAAGYAVTALLGPQATRAAIEAAIAQLRAALGSDDLLFVYVSSHGALPVPTPAGAEGRRMSIVAYDSGDVLGEHSADATAYLLRLERTSVRDRLVQDLAQAPTRQTHVLIDTCYSGDMLEGLPGAGQDFQRASNGGRAERDSISLEAWTRLAESTRSRYTLLTATSPGELALGPPPEPGVFASPVNPGRQLRGSFFTQTLFEYLERHRGLLHPAFADAQAFTARMARQVSGGSESQTPRMLSTLGDAQDRL